MKKWLFLSLTLALSVHCWAERKPYKVLAAPEKGLNQYGKVTVGNFDTRTFLADMKAKNGRNSESYIALAPKTNQIVRGYVVEALNGRAAGQGPGLALTGDLLKYVTGDAGARAAGTFLSNSGQNRMGNGYLDYEFTLTSAGKVVAVFSVHSDIKANKEGAYRAVGSYIKWFLDDFAE